MKIEYTGRQTEVPEEIRRIAEKKLRKLERVLRGITHVHVILTVDKHREIAEVTAHSPHLTLAAVEESHDLATSLTLVTEKLIRQAQRHTGKRRERKRKSTEELPALWSGILARESPKVIHSRRFLAKPMTVDEAVLELGNAEDAELVVFRDAGTHRVNVLYKRKDGNLGLIEPEA